MRQTLTKLAAWARGLARLALGRTHPLHFAEGLVLFEDGFCRLRATTSLAMHQEQVERVGAVALAQGLDEVPLGYGRVRGAASGPLHVDFER